MYHPVLERVLDEGEAIITYATPFFFLMIVLEYAMAWIAGRRVYRFNDSITDLSCGVIEQVLGIFLRTLTFGGYVLLYDHFRLLEIRDWAWPAKLGAIAVSYLAIDLTFYWFHRWAHVWAAPWATHVVHHSSEEMNLIVALRQSAFEDVFAAVFYLPLAVLGCPPFWYAAMFSFNLIWQFWCHTRLIGKLGPLEWVFNTPSHHRVHHARNPRYLDKNYAGTLIIWDRLFGTFAEETEQPVYGITKPLASLNPWWANLHYWFELADLARRAPYRWDKLKVWFMPLGWTPRGLEPTRHACEITPEMVIKYNPRAPRSLNAYVMVQFLLTLALSEIVMRRDDLDEPARALFWPALAVFVGLLNLGGLFEQRRWALYAEAARIVVVAGATWLSLGESSAAWLRPAVLLLGLASLAWLSRYRGVLTNPAFVPVAKAGLREPEGVSALAQLR